MVPLTRSSSEVIITSGVDVDPDQLPSGAEKRRAVRSMFDTIAPRYDLVNRIMTFRLDVASRRQTLRHLELSGGSLVADLACGTGDFCRELTRAGHLPVGFDLSMGMLAAARTQSSLVHADVLRLPVPDASLDGAVCGYALRNLTDLDSFFEELARVTRPDGRIALLDAAEPERPLLRRGHAFYFGSVVPRIGATLSDPTAYRYLPKSLAYLPPPSELTRRIATPGFVEVERRMLFGGIFQLWTATRARPRR